ncbi:hypothetical protein P4H66_19375 [Paenibacillus dokdonensis]|uniref:Uncharacterized protein n=1 Tax=Paenibacillus dokdonensis TaxID=2567944 RepID=A0ABU6GQF9_9BACL|nr:hypothetical protein [Paenibacillus dokdonensis]MEC0241967.1 hypothetical protein [Paenibacillus dokdonensis]
MKAALKYEVLADLSKPVDEIVEFISLMLQSHPGKRIEILQQIDQHVGDALAELQREPSNEITEDTSAEM